MTATRISSRRWIWIALGAFAAAGRPATAFAFAEDICYPDGGPPVTCSPLPQQCYLPDGSLQTNPTTACLHQALVTFQQEGTVPGTRSAVHADATALLAQAAGFSALDAYWIAAYDQGVDNGQFQPYDLNGKVVDAGLTTVQLSGPQRVANNTGGVFFHFNAPYNGGLDGGLDAGVNGLYPNAMDPEVEPTLTSFRAWAWAGNQPTPGAAPLCTGGLTVLDNGNYGSASTCFNGGSGVPAWIGGSLPTIPLLGQTNYQNAYEGVDAGIQVIEDLPDGGQVLATDFDVYLGGSTAVEGDARLGIFVHALADRISHHVCEDQGVLVGPTAGPDGGFFVDLTNAGCQQELHALRHMWEIGVPFSQVAAEDQTTNAALSNVYAELMAFAAARGVANPDAGVIESTLLADVATAIETPAAPARLTAIAQVACSFGYAPFPGTIACTQAQVAIDAGPPADGGVAADAGGVVPQTVTTDESPNKPSTGCSTSPGANTDGATLAACLGALSAVARRRRRA